MNFEVGLVDNLETNEVLEIYRVNGWSSAEKPGKLLPALMNFDSLNQGAEPCL